MRNETRSVVGATGDLAAAATLLTRLALPIDHAAAAARGAKAAWAYPVVGAGLGLAAGAAVLGLSALGASSWLSAAAALALLAAATGALHEDGLADFADGVGGGRDPEHALEIMKDSRIGAFGAVALTLSLLLRWSALAALSPLSALFALIGAAAWSRGLLPILMAATPPARPDGLSAGVGRPPLSVAIAAILLGALALIPSALWLGWPAAAALMFAPLAALYVMRLALAKLGGGTGDVLGAAQVAAETAALAALSLNL